MITVNELELEIRKTLLDKKPGWKHRFEMLQTCKLYVSTNPCPAFVEKEYNRIAKCIMRREAVFDLNSKKTKVWVDSITYQALKKEHDKEYGTDCLRHQLEALELILKKAVNQ